MIVCRPCACHLIYAMLFDVNLYTAGAHDCGSPHCSCSHNFFSLFLSLSLSLSLYLSLPIYLSLLAPRYAAPEVRRGASVAGMLPQFQHPAAVTKAAWLWLIDQAQLNAFVSVGVGPDLFTTFRTMISSVGLGALVPNTVVLPYQEPW